MFFREFSMTTGDFMSKHYTELFNLALGQQIHQAALALVLRNLPRGVAAQKLKMS
jgi:hypothetical protein